jgi:hypothetical protein
MTTAKEKHPVIVGDPELVALDEDPGFAQLIATTPNGARLAIAELHLDCGATDVLTQHQDDGSTRRLCKACALDAARSRKE